ncbi:MAG: AraC family transcriptional regulator [Colwellia sp.]|nr:AraC family transcriptional regulator [Colwellia sp.]
MSILTQYLHVIGIFQGLILAALLILGAKTSIASRILGTLCLLLALNFLGPFIYLEREINIFSPLIAFHAFLPASFGALLYLYCRHAIIDRPFALKDLWHLLPLVVCYLLNIEFYLSSAEVKLDVILHGTENLKSLNIGDAIISIQAFAYLGVSMFMVRRIQNKAKQTLSNFNPEMFSWLWKLLILALVIWSLKEMMGTEQYPFLFYSTGDVLIIVLIYSIAMAQWRNPVLFQIAQFNTRTIAQEALASTHIILSEEVAIIESKIEASIKTSSIADDATSATNSGALDPSIRSSLLKVVRQNMQEQQTYLDDQLTLTRLAEIVGISTHHLSEVLNQHEGKNFYQFVNEYRINYICEKMKHDNEIKILDLAMSAGFSSRSTFNAVFKQFVKLTPSQYRKQLAI